MKVVIIGGVAGGASAAARVRRLDEQAQIIVFERSGFVSYANCGLPYYIGGVITDQSELTLQTPESFRQRFRIDVRVRHEVRAVDTKNKTVTVCALDTGEVFTETWDKLLFSPGARPTVPDLKGVDGEQVFSLRTVEDTLRIRRFVEERKPAAAVIAGGGYIGIEMAENLSELGVKVTIVQRPAQLLSPFDPDMAVLVHARMRKAGIRLLLSTAVAGFEQEEGRVRTLLKDKEPLTSDMVILAIGVTPDTQLAKSAGLELGMKGSILVNDRMETSAPDVYAVGDAVQVKHYVTGSDALIALAGPANKQGRIAADNICGRASRYKGSMGSSVIKLFDMTAASTGISEKTAAAAGIEVEKAVLFPASHASYYPGAKTLALKVICDKKTRRLLGAQAVGYEGTDKRIDVIAAALYAGLTGPELKELDLAYAPPYSSAKDPVNMAGFILENLFEGIVKQYYYTEVKELPRDGSVALVDARTPEEYAGGHAPGFVNIPVDELRGRLDELPAGKKVYVMCQSGLRSYIASRILMQNGFDCYNFAGGYTFYRAQEREELAAAETLPCGAKKG